MRIIKLLILVLAVPLFLQGQNSIKGNLMDQFEHFRNKEKFLEDEDAFYTGVTEPKLRAILNEKINLACDDFKNVAIKENSDDQKYREQIETGLRRFSDIYLQLDTEDRERICEYFEELMDIVGLESSGGLLNKFIYGFDPTMKFD